VVGSKRSASRERDVNHARRQQYRRLSRAGRLGLTRTAAAGLGLFAVSTGAAVPGALLLALAVTLGFRARHWLSLAERSGVGARSEDVVRRALAPLQERGWWLRHGLRWHGGGDIDSVAIAPSGLGFTIETKTRTYDERQLARVLGQARWLGRRRRRWCHRALPVLCVVRAARVERYEHGVLVVSIDRLVPALWEVANSVERGESMQLRGRSMA
jgi:Nuclease-related domain